MAVFTGRLHLKVLSRDLKEAEFRVGDLVALRSRFGTTHVSRSDLTQGRRSHYDRGRMRLEKMT